MSSTGCSTSLINAVIVVDAPRQASVEAILAARVRQANPAALALTGRRDAADVPLSDLLAGDLDLWRDRFERLRTQGKVPATEARIAGCPVLFAASWLTDEPGLSSGIVIAAQDISDWKRTQAELSGSRRD